MTARPDVLRRGSAWWRAYSATSRSSRHDRRSCTVAGAPTSHRFSGTPRSPWECAVPHLESDRDGCIAVRPIGGSFRIQSLLELGAELSAGGGYLDAARVTHRGRYPATFERGRESVDIGGFRPLVREDIHRIQGNDIDMAEHA